MDFFKSKVGVMLLIVCLAVAAAVTWLTFRGGSRRVTQEGTLVRHVTVYLNLQEITEVQKKDVLLKDVASVYCSDKVIQSKCNAMKVKTIRDKKGKKYVESALDVIRKLEAIDSSIQVNNVGKVEYIINWAKTIFVCIVCFCGAAFAIMTFNNDVSVMDVFGEVYRLITGTESSGFTILEMSYSVGLAVGIILFFNHFAKWKLTTDPTPLEVEMRLYEDNVSKTLIQNEGRKEQEVDVQ